VFLSPCFSNTRRLRELTGIAYERELRLDLGKLEGQFQLWKDGKVDTFELEHYIHKFHNGPARMLYSRYTDLKPEMVLPYAVTYGSISDEECPDEIIDR